MANYCDISDLTDLGIPAAALSGFTDDEKTSAIDAMSSEADSYLSARYKPPFTSWPVSLRMHVARGAVYILMSKRGFNPNAGGNELIVKGYDDAKSWLTKVARGFVTLPVVDTAPAATAIPEVSSTAGRWDSV